MGESLSLSKTYAMTRFPIILALCLLLTAVSPAQEELLPEGAYGTTIHGGIKAGEYKSYSLVGYQGQILKANLITKEIEKGASLDLVDSGGDSVLGPVARLTQVSAVDLVLPKTDRYELHIKAGNLTCSYILEVTLDDADEARVVD